MKVLKGLYYSKDHEWVKVEGEVASKDETFSAVESVKAASDVYLPVGGKVVEINEALEDDPALLNTAPYESWIAKVELSDKSELEELMTSEEYEKFLAEEV